MEALVFVTKTCWDPILQDVQPMCPHFLPILPENWWLYFNLNKWRNKSDTLSENLEVTGKYKFENNNYP